MSSIDTFCAVHASGLLIPNQSAVTAMSLLFDKVYLPAHLEAVSAFSKAYRIKRDDDEIPDIVMESADGDTTDPFEDLNEEQRATAMRYLDWSVHFSMRNARLFGEVFQTNAFEDGSPMKVELIEKGAPGELNKYRVGPAQMIMTHGDEDLFPNLLKQGYVPIVTHRAGILPTKSRIDDFTAKQLAALLAMKSVEMLFPRTRAAQPDLILEARYKLRDQLPQFWGAMFKLSADLRKIYSSSNDHAKIQIEAENLVDTTVRPALLDLRHKLEAERKQWFFRVLSPIQKGLRLMIGNPPITQEQLIVNALLLASDASSAGADHLRTIEALKNSSGLTYLLELDRINTKAEQGVAPNA